MPIKDSSATLRPELSASVQEYDTQKAAAKFIGRRVLPVFRSPVQTAEFPVFNREGVLEVPDTSHADGAGYNRVNSSLGGHTFNTEDHGLEEVLTDRKRARYASMLNLEAAIANSLWYKILLAHERRVQTLLATADAAHLHATGAAWATIATATMLVVRNAAIAVMDACGCAKRDLSLIVSSTDFEYLKSNAQILDAVKYTNPGSGRDDVIGPIIAAYLGLKECLVGDGGYNSAGKGLTPSISRCWPAGYAYVALLAEGEGAALEAPALGRTVLWTGDCPEFPVVETYRDETTRANVLRVRDDTDEIVQTDDISLFCQAINTAATS